MRFQYDIACDAQRDYKHLIAVGKSSEDAERILFDYYKPDCCSSQESQQYWMGLALVEWTLGRLTNSVKERALNHVEQIMNARLEPDSRRFYQELQDLLMSPQPSEKTVRKPVVHHCPWRAGSLLAYRICSNKVVSGDPCFMKYALLRVVKIDQRPFSRLVPSDYYDESMRISLYGWIGNEIPEPDIVNDLAFIGISIPPKENDILAPYLRAPEMWAYFDWRSSKFAKGDITLIAVDDEFETHIPTFLNFNAVPFSLHNYLSLDARLTTLLQPYLMEK